MRSPVLIHAAAVAASIAMSAEVRAQALASRPNVVILLADDLGYSDVAWNGGEIKTPALDKLASDGVKLDAYYAMPVCSPTRAALLTGRYPFRYGLQTSVVKPWATYGLPTDERTLPQALREVGYETAIVGKWHLGHSKPEYLPMARGFEHQYGHYNGALDYFTHERDGGFDWHRDQKRSDDQGYSTTLLGDEAVRLIKERDKNRPLFLYVPFQAVHGPFQVPKEYSDPYDVARPRRKTYMGMVAALDEQVGRITKAIHDAGMDGKTLIVFSSDNGGPEPGVVTRNGDLRAGKGTHYEGGVRVCASATWAGVIPAGSHVAAPLHTVDWYATCLTLAGASLEQPKPIDGRDILPTLTGKATAPPHDEVLINIAPRSGALRQGNWKLVVNGWLHIAEEAVDADSPTTRPTTYELYDVATERQEQHDVAGDHPDIVAKMRARFEQLQKTAAPAFQEEKPAGYRVPKVWGEFDGAAATTQPSS